MEALSRILAKIEEISTKSGRLHPPVLMAVSKFQPLEKIISLYHEGQRVFGENYVQELLAKKQALEARGLRDLEFHFIGKLQTNKVRQLLPQVKAIHSVDSLRLLKEIEIRAQSAVLRPEIYLQVNIDCEATKGGFQVEELDDVCEALSGYQNVIPAGLMAIPEPGKDPEKAFRRMKELSDRYQKVLGSGLSMGMSADYVSAIQSGATIIRMGEALFGKRE